MAEQWESWVFSTKHMDDAFAGGRNTRLRVGLFRTYNNDMVRQKNYDMRSFKKMEYSLTAASF